MQYRPLLLSVYNWAGTRLIYGMDRTKLQLSGYIFDVGSECEDSIMMAVGYSSVNYLYNYKVL